MQGLLSFLIQRYEYLPTIGPRLVTETLHAILAHSPLVLP
jgi:hypothetical protein